MTSDGTDGGQGVKCPPGSSDVGPFLEMSPLWLPLFPKRFINFKLFVYSNLFFATAAMYCKALCMVFF